MRAASAHFGKLLPLVRHQRRMLSVKALTSETSKAPFPPAAKQRRARWRCRGQHKRRHRCDKRRRLVTLNISSGFPQGSGSGNQVQVPEGPNFQGHFLETGNSKNLSEGHISQRISRNVRPSQHVLGMKQFNLHLTKCKL